MTGWRRTIAQRSRIRTGRDDFKRSLGLVRGLDFDVLAPWTASLDGGSYAFTDRERSRRRVDGILDRICRG